MFERDVVGRDIEFSWLRENIELVGDGIPRVLLLSGAPGVGKTSLMRSAASTAEDAGFSVAFGRSYEGIETPYHCWGELIRNVAHEGDNSLTEFGAVLTGRATRPRSQNDPFDESGRRDQDFELVRGSLYHAVIDAVIARCQESPLALFVDDLHWADSASLELLTTFVHALDDRRYNTAVPLLILCGFRPEEDYPPISATLSRFRQIPICHRLDLTGLDTMGVTDLLERSGIGRPSPDLVLTVQDLTVGNPLFIKELVLQFERHDAVMHDQGFAVLRKPASELPIPRDVERSITERLMVVDEEQRRLLEAAAILGGAFSVGDLAAVLDTNRAALPPLLLPLGEFLSITRDRANFVHPLIRHVIYQAIPPTERQEMHALAAHLLESRYANDLDAHLWTIQNHLLFAGSTAEPSQVVDICQRAAARAETAADWLSAAKGLAAAANALRSEHERGPLHERAAEHYRAAGEVALCLQQFELAAHAYRADGDEQRLARVMVMASLEKNQSVPPSELPDMAPYEDALAIAGSDGGLLRARVLVSIGHTYFHASRPSLAVEHAHEALAILDTFPQALDIIIDARTLEGMAQAQSMNVLEGVTALRAATALAETHNEHILGAVAQARLTNVLYLSGEVINANVSGETSIEKAQTAHTPRQEALTWGSLTMIAAARGDFESAETSANQARRLFARSHYGFGLLLALSARAYAHYLNGETGAAGTLLDEVTEPGRVFEAPGASVAHRIRLHQILLDIEESDDASFGSRGDVVHYLTGFVATRKEQATTLYSTVDWCAVLEIAHHFGLNEIAEIAVEHLDSAHERGAALTYGWPHLIPRVLGCARLLLGQHEQAREAFEKAYHIARYQRLLPELMMTCFHWSRLENAVNNASRARELLQEADRYRKEAGVSLYADRISMFAQLLDVHLVDTGPDIERGGSTHPPRPDTPPPLVMMVTDIVEFVYTVATLGNVEAQALMHEHNKLLRREIARHNGREIVHMGDGIMATFDSAVEGVSCAISFQNQCAAQLTRENSKIRVRVGLDAGEALVEEDRLFGQMVNAAVRICNYAQAGQVLASKAVTERLDARHFALRSLGHVALKGFLQPLPLAEVKLRERLG